MSENLDPYYKWLGIAPKDQPPNHYRLLGIDAFERNADVICNAADRQMAHLRSVSTGRNANLSQKLLNEISAARVCLLDSAQKAAYDSQLRAEQQAADLPPAAVAASRLEVASSAPPVALSIATTSNSAPRQAVTNGNAHIIKLAAGGVVLAGLLLIWLLGGDDADSGSNANQSGNPTAVAAVTASSELSLPRAEPTSPKRSESSDSAANSNRSASEDSPTVIPRDDAGGEDVNRSSTSSDSEKSVSSEKREPTPDQADHPDASSQAEPSTDVAVRTTPEESGVDEKPTVSAPAAETSTSLPLVPHKLAVPSGDEQRETLLQVKGVFEESYAKAKTTAGNAVLAKLLYDKAEELKDDPTVRFVMLRDGYDRAIEVKDFALAIQFVDRLTEEYELDAIKLRLHMLTQASLAARLPTERREVAELALSVVDRAVKAKRFEDASKLVDLAEGLAVRARDVDLRGRVRGVSEAVKGSQRAWKAIQPSLETLQTSPDDADANLACGRYFCFVAGDWQRGLPMLCRGSDQALAEVARQDRANPLGPQDQQQLGDVWWNLGEAQHGSKRVDYQVRALHWYQRALPGLSGLAKAKVEKRLAESDAPTAEPSGPFQSYKGTWSIKYARGHGRRYVVDSQGNVIHAARQGKLSRRQGQVFLDFGDGKLERVTLAGRELRIEHFNPASSFPKRPLLGTGSRIVTVDPGQRQPFREFEGLWVIKYTNKVERRYGIDRLGNVAFAESRGKLVIEAGEVLLEFGEGALERLEVQANTLRIERFKPRSRYPGDFLMYGTGVRQR